MKYLTLFCMALIATATAAAKNIDESTLETLLDPYEYSNVRISPSGKYLSLIQTEGEINTLVVLDMASMKPVTSVKYGEKGKTKKLNVCCTRWINNELLSYGTTRKLGTLEGEGRTPYMFLLAADGSRNDQIWTAYGNYENNSQKRGKLFKGFASVESILEDDDDHIMLSVLSWEARPILARMRLSNGDMKSIRRLPEKTMSVMSTRVTESPSASDIDLLVSVAARGKEYLIGENEYLLSNDGGDWEKVAMTLPGFDGPWEPRSLSQSFLVATAQKTKDPDAPIHAVLYDREKDEWSHLYEIGFATVESVLTDSRDGTGVASRIHYVDDQPRIAFFESDDNLSGVLQYFTEEFPGHHISITGTTKDSSKVVVAVSSSNVLGDYYLYDKEANSVRYLIGMSSKLKEIPLSQAQYFAYTNTDGVKIPGWFQPAKTGEKSPLVVVIHGGPHGPYNSFGFYSSWHVLNQLGYSVYAPNFRGSGGFGVSFEKSGYGKWGTGMIDDMQQGAQALVDAGLVDDSQICAMGGSYGGYGTAQSLVRHADFYDCGIIIAGFFDIEALVNKTDVTDSYTGRQYMKAATGGTLEEQRNISPLRNLDKIKAPILLLHGKKDERTPFKGAQEMVSAMKKAGLDFEYKYYNKEGHGNRKMENRVDEWQRVAKFLERTRKSTLASRSVGGDNSSAE